MVMNSTICTTPRTVVPRGKSLQSVIHAFIFLVASFLLVQGPTNHGSCHGLEFRSATADDINQALKILLQQAMNPLGLSQETLLVVTASSEDDKATKTVWSDPKQQRSSSSSSASSWPLLGFGQIRPLNDNYSELASLYVRPDYRTQGIGTALVQQLLDRHNNHYNNNKNTKGNKSSSNLPLSSSSSQPPTPTLRPPQVCLLTLKPTAPFYEPLGFRVASDVERTQLPISIQLEYKAGQALSAFLGNDLICMIQHYHP
jgi:GNAT superfamily N-acetyltransferase